VIQEQKYKGIVVEESLEDKNILQDMEILSTSVSETLGWHICTVLASKKNFEKFSKTIKNGKWYAHFWNGRDVVVIFYAKTFQFNFDDKSTWKPVLHYGRSLGIPDEQLDFPIA